MTFPCAVVGGDIAGIRGDVFLIVSRSSVFAFSAGSMVPATIDVGRQGVEGESGRVEIGASRGVAESSCDFAFDQNRTDGVEGLFFNRLGFDNVRDVGELLEGSGGWV